MLGYVLIFLQAAISGAGTAAQKLYTKKTQLVEHGSEIFLLIHVIGAIIYFGAMSGFNLAINKTSLIYSACYGIICLASLLVNMVAMSNMNLIMLSVFSRGNTMIVWLVGIVLFQEAFTVSGVISALLILMSILMPLFEQKSEKTGKFHIKNYIIGILIILLSTVSTLLLKFYSMEPKKMPDSIFCFYTNVFMAGFTLFRLIQSLKNGNFIGEMQQIKSNLLLTPLYTVCTTSATLISMYVLKIMPLSLNSVLSYAAGSIVVFVNSKWVFRERYTKHEIIAFVLSSMAVLITIIG